MPYTLTDEHMRVMFRALSIAIKSTQTDLVEYFISNKTKGNGKTIGKNLQDFEELYKALQLITTQSA